MDNEIMEQFTMLVGMMEKMNANMLTKEDATGFLTKDDIEPIADRSANKAAALIENKLGKRIDGLFDGYKLAHEKQWEMERRIEELERIVQELLTRTA